MAGLADSFLQQIQIWSAFAHLRSANDAERVRAMETLRASGSASLPYLRFALNGVRDYRRRFAAAVVLHWLGKAQGMETLIKALQWELPTTPEIAAELEAAFVTIGSPDAVNALLVLWRQLPDWGDNQAVMASICRVWASVKDPRALDGLLSRATRIPELFEETVPKFGEMAVLRLETMARDPEPARRIMAIRALRHISSGRSFAALVPLLRDPHPDVRAAVPAALEGAGGIVAATRVIVEAIEVGYSTRAAVETVLRGGPAPYLTLQRLIARWDPRRSAPTHDTGDAVLAALPILAGAPLSNADLIPTLCSLLERRPGPEILVAAARVIGERRQSGEACDAPARSALLSLLTSADAPVRAEAAGALASLGEPLGKQWNQLIADCRPQGSILQKLQAVLRGGSDAGQAAAQAVQQVSQWFSRASKATVDRLQAVALTPNNGADVAARDPRTPDLLRQLLDQALTALQQTTLPEETEDRLSLCVAAIRALSRVGTSAALSARAELLQALYTVTHSMVYQGASSGLQRKSEMREVSEMVRGAAAETLAELYGARSFALFLEALYAPQPEVHGTAMAALGRLGDVRALPHLQPIARDTAHPLSSVAAQAIAAIHHTNPDVIELLRGSSAHTQPDILLRPASGSADATAPDELLRPTASTPPLPPGPNTQQATVEQN